MTFTGLLWGAVFCGNIAFAAEQLPAELGDLVTASVERGVPGHLVEVKAREGLAKGVPIASIRPVLDRLVDNLAAAQQMHEDADEVLLSTTAGALRAGASRSAIVEVGSSSPEARIRAISTLADLLRLHFAERDAVRLTVRAAYTSNPQASLIAVSETAGALVAAGVVPRVAATQITRALDPGANDDELAAVQTANDGMSP